MNTIAMHYNQFYISFFELLFGKLAPIPGSILGNVLVWINTIVMTTLSVLYFYQIIMSLSSIVIKSKKFHETDVYPSYIFVTCARNEERVIEQLYRSIRNLNYPQDKIEVHLVADNCDDNTVAIAKRLGIQVFERNDLTQIGKSYALDFYFKQRLEVDKSDDFAGYIVVDTDNVYDKNYLKEINKTLQQTKADVIAAYRASTNIGESFWAYGTGYSFLREISLLHKVRERFGFSSYVSGTSFFVSHSKIASIGGWPYHQLIEDIEFSASHVLGGEITHYNHDAIFYDEQPNNMKESMRQRLRWVKGLYQVSSLMGWKLFKGIFAGKKNIRHRFSSYETFLFIVPFPCYVIFWLFIYGILSALNLYLTMDFQYFIQTYLFTIFDFVVSFFIFTTIMSYIISFINWKRIKMSAFKKLTYPFLSFFFLATYIPLFLIAPFIKVKWKKVHHYGLKQPIE